MTFRLVAKEIASKHGVHATFMPKPLADRNGSGMHVNMSLFKGEHNAFFSAKEQDRLSPLAKQFLAGILKHIRELTVVTNPWVNSYKRLMPGFEAPAYVTWAFTNRSDLVRVPRYKPGKEAALRLELRSPDAACNPYLSFAAILAAGLDGIQSKAALPPAAKTNVASLSDEERRKQKIEQLPRDLGEAIEMAEGSSLLKKAFGDHTFNSFLNNKRLEWEKYRTAVTDFERQTYLPML